VTGITTSEPVPERLLQKCLSIYRKKGSLRAVSKLAERVIQDTETEAKFFENCFKPAARREFFPEFTVTLFLAEALEIYRSEKTRSSALIAIWEKIDGVIPLTNDEYEQIVARLEEELAKVENPPTSEDWVFLDDWLTK
jgi:hypothetical protein